MIYGSVCSGIEAATTAWHPFGWRPSFFSEIDKFPRAVLAHHYPQTPLHGDFTTIREGEYDPIDLLVGGTPCQSFSVAGLRQGLADKRGQLALEFLLLARRLRPRWVVWENVPGVLSKNGGRDFGSILGGLVECGYGFAYRVLDAQYFGLAQRRKRVFVVGYLGDWRRAAAVLFEPESLSGHPAPRREKGQGVALPITTRVDRCGEHREAHGNNLIAHALNAHGRIDAESETFVVTSAQVSPSLRAQAQAVTGNSAVSARGGDVAVSGMSVRRLTPRECERLQGFPDDFTMIPYRGKAAADGPRYKALGNSMAVPVMAWIGQRIAAVDALS